MQLAAMPDEPQAQREWERLRKAYPDLLGELTLMVERVELSDKHQTFYRVRVGNWKDVKAPTALCDKLKQRGARCFVVRRSS